MAKNFYDVVTLIKPNGNTPVEFSGTLDGNVTVRDAQLSSGQSYQRAVFTIAFYGTPSKFLKESGFKFESGEKEYRVKSIASFGNAKTVAGLRPGDPVIGAGYLFKGKNNEAWIIVQALARVTKEGSAKMYTSLNSIYLKNPENEKPVFIVGTYSNKYTKDLKKGGFSAYVSLYKQREFLQKLLGEGVTISGKQDWSSLKVVAFGYSADTLRGMNDGDDFVAAGTISLDAYNGVTRPTFFASTVISSREAKKSAETSGDDAAEQAVDTPVDEPVVNETVESEVEEPNAVSETSPDTESGEAVDLFDL